jgi:polyhydroxybutyrate depolymerase
MLPFRQRFVLLTLLCALVAGLPGATEAQTRREARAEALAGLVQETLLHDGRMRSWYIHVPPALAGAQGLAAVLVFHGGEGDGRDAAAVSRMTAAAGTQGFVAVFPDSPGTQWNDGRTQTASGIDDVGFVRALIADLALRHGVDPGRVHIAGISNGGMFVQRLACDAADAFRAGAVVAAAMPADLAPVCAPARGLPLIFLTGTEDRLMPREGGEIPSLRLLGIGVGGTVLSLDGTQAFWTDRFACRNAGTPVALPDIADDGTTVTRQDVTGCADGAELAFLTIAGGGHNWPGSGMGGRMAGTVSEDIDATAEILTFFGRHGL